jgi:hypothetical protein
MSCGVPAFLPTYSYITTIEIKRKNSSRCGLPRRVFYGKTVSSGYHGEVLLDILISQADGAERSTNISLQRILGRWFFLRLFVERYQ